MKFKGYVEVTEEGYNKRAGGIRVCDQDAGNKWRFFMKEQKFPIIFESDAYTFEVNKEGIIKSKRGGETSTYAMPKTLQALRQALDKSDEIRK